MRPTAPELPSRSIALGNLIVARLVGAVEGHAEAVRVAGLGEQGPRPLKVANRGG